MEWIEWTDKFIDSLNDRNDPAWGLVTTWATCFSRRMQCPEIVRDAAQEICAHVYRNLGTIAAVGPRNRRAYVYRMASNCCVDFLRTKEKLPLREPLLWVGRKGWTSPGSDSLLGGFDRPRDSDHADASLQLLEREVELAAMLRRLRDCIEQLGNEKKRAQYNVVKECLRNPGYTAGRRPNHVALAEALGATEVQTKANYHNALKTLRACMEGNRA